MREKIQTYLDWVSKTGVLVVLFTTLFLFWNITTDFYDTPKFLGLVLFVAVFLVLTILNFVLNGKIQLVRTPLDLPLLVILVAAVISTFISPSQNVSIFGFQTHLHGSVTTLITYILFYFLLINNIRKNQDVAHIQYFLLLAGTALSILSLVSYTGVRWLPLQFTASNAFTPTGSNFSTTTLLALILPFLLFRLNYDSTVAKPIYGVMLALFGLTISLVGTTSTQIAALFTTILTLSIIGKNTIQKNLPFLLAPVVVVALVTILSLIPPVGANQQTASSGGKNPFYTLSQNFQREVHLSFPISWKIAVSAFRDSPIFGTGPATDVFNFTAYKPAEFNSDKYWNIRFDKLYNEYLSILGNLGAIGLIGLVLLTVVFISYSLQVIRKVGNDEEQQLNKSLAIAGIAFFIILLLHFTTLIVWVLGILFLACFFIINRNLTDEVSYKSEKINSNSFKISLDLLPTILILAVGILVITSLIFVGRFTLADIHHQKAIQALNSNQALIAYNEFIAAENLNPKIDLYKSNLAQTNFAIANAIAASKGPTESSPSGSLTEQDKANIQQFLSQAIAEGRAATTLSPRYAGNWEVLGAIYRQISGVAQNALQFSLDAYGRAIALDPLNPLLRLDVGGIYYSVKGYDLAIRFFSDVTSLKPDYPNGYYNLAVALRDKGDLPNAQAIAEKLVSIVDPKSSDYKVAANFLADLKAKIATNSSQALAAPTSTDNGALQKKELPKVLDLPKPENIASPAAVKK